MKAWAIVLVALVATTAYGVQVADYGWEDGTGTILGSQGNLADPTNVSGAQIGSNGALGSYTCPGPNSGERYLHVAEDPHSGTPEAYVAYIENLSEGDTVTASFFGYDETETISPSLRIWAHFALNGDVMSEDGAPTDNNSTYTNGSGWNQLSNTWTIPAGKQALVIEVRLYSVPTTSADRTDYWIDDLHVEAPDTATITVPAVVPEPAALALLGLGGLLLRRRR